MAVLAVRVRVCLVPPPVEPLETVIVLEMAAACGKMRANFDNKRFGTEVSSNWPSCWPPLPWLGIVLLAIVANSFWLHAQQPSQAQSPLRGRVIDGKSGEGLDSAEVTVLHQWNDEMIAQTDTDREGNFAFSGLQQGRYRVRAVRRGYVDLLPGKSTARTISAPLAEEQALNITLTQTGVITGKVMDPGGLPIAGARAAALVRRADADGVQFLPQGPTVFVDDRGEYRLYGLPPGRYTVVVSPSGSPSGNPFAPVYFPGTHDISRAEFFSLEGGTVRSRSDLVVSSTELHSLRGVVSGLLPGQEQQTAVSLMPASGAGFPFGIVDADQEGRFQFSGVPPGAYYVIALSPAIGRSAFGPIPGPGSRQGVVRVEIASQDVDDVVVELRSAVEIGGLAKFDRPGVANSACLSGASVTLRPVNPARPGAPLTSRVTPEGQFKFQGVFPGNYRVFFQAIGDRCSLENLTFGEHRVEGRTITIGGDLKQEQMALMLTAEAGTVMGSIAPSDGLPAGGVLVLMMPGFLNGELYSEQLRATTADADGRFEFPHVPPGQYRLIAMKSMPSNKYLDPLFWSEEQVDPVDVIVKGGRVAEAVLRIIQ